MTRAHRRLMVPDIPLTRPRQRPLLLHKLHVAFVCYFGSSQELGLEDVAGGNDRSGAGLGRSSLGGRGLGIMFSMFADDACFFDCRQLAIFSALAQVRNTQRKFAGGLREAPACMRGLSVTQEGL